MAIVKLLRYLRPAGLELGDEGGVLGGGHALREDVKNLGQIGFEQGAALEPEGGKDATSKDAICGLVHARVLAVTEFEPIDLLVADAPHQVLLDAVSPVDLELGVEVETHGAGGHFGEQFRAADDVIVFDARSASA